MIWHCFSHRSHCPLASQSNVLALTLTGQILPVPSYTRMPIVNVALPTFETTQSWIWVTSLSKLFPYPHAMSLQLMRPLRAGRVPLCRHALNSLVVFNAGGRASRPRLLNPVMIPRPMSSSCAGLIEVCTDFNVLAWTLH